MGSVNRRQHSAQAKVVPHRQRQFTDQFTGVRSHDMRPQNLSPF
ncbi:MAG TPA: hypothetical protein VH599_03795 [Ktedonobacterales bacterium]